MDFIGRLKKQTKTHKHTALTESDVRLMSSPHQFPVQLLSMVRVPLSTTIKQTLDREGVALLLFLALELQCFHNSIRHSTEIHNDFLCQFVGGDREVAVLYRKFLVSSLQNP